jgi:hypothetical protein
MVIQAVMFVTGGQIFMNVIFVLYPRWTLTLLEWNMLVFSSVTSVAAVYYALFAYWHSEVLVETTVETSKREIYDRLGVPFIKSLIEFGRKVDNRWSQLTPEQQTSILNKADVIVDRVFSSLGRKVPKPERKKVRAMK